MTTFYALLAGALAGLGLMLIVRELLPSHPELGSALARLDVVTVRAHRDWAAADAYRQRRSQIEQRLAAWLLRRLTTTLGLRIPRRELDLVGDTAEAFVLRKVGMGLLGLLTPPVLALAMGLAGLWLPFLMPVGGSLVFAGLLFYAPDLDLRRKAADARGEFRRAVCSYIDLVGLERLADAGSVEALERAAEIGQGWVFTRIRESLLHAQLSGDPPWRGLTTLADELGVPELGDVADIVSLSGEDGAAVYDTLRARASSLRTAILSQHAARANQDSEKMVVPVALLGLVFLALLTFPAFARIMFS